MDYWHSMLKDLKNKKNLSDPSSQHYLMKQPQAQTYKNTSEVRKYSQRNQYHLTPPFAHIHLTEREAQCVYHLIQGKTLKSTAEILDLSPRTVEFYVNNIKDRMGIIKKKDTAEHHRKL